MVARCTSGLIGKPIRHAINIVSHGPRSNELPPHRNRIKARRKGGER
jgi:hypothetical protein